MTLLIGFVLGILGSLTAAAIWEVWGDRIQKGIADPAFSLSGMWLACFDPVSPSQSQGVEIVRIRQRRDSVRLYLENYNSVRRSVLQLKGTGKYRSSHLAAVYYLNGKDRLDTGTFILRTRSSDSADTVMVGVYTQLYDRHGKGETTLRSEPYELHPLDIPVSVRIRRLWRRTFFRDYAELTNWLAARGVPFESMKPRGRAELPTSA
jgi:hypothetical protein